MSCNWSLIWVLLITSYALGLSDYDNMLGMPEVDTIIILHCGRQGQSSVVIKPLHFAMCDYT